MNGKSVLGMIFANIHEEALDSLTAMRTMGSVPFCSRFRLIDFPLSNLVESGVTKIGVVTNANFRSLMDHIGTGKPWDLSRKSDGFFLASSVFGRKHKHLGKSYRRHIRQYEFSSSIASNLCFDD